MFVFFLSFKTCDWLDSLTLHRLQRLTSATDLGIFLWANHTFIYLKRNIFRATFAARITQQLEVTDYISVWESVSAASVWSVGPVHQPAALMDSVAARMAMVTDSPNPSLKSRTTVTTDGDSFISTASVPCSHFLSANLINVGRWFFFFLPDLLWTWKTLLNFSSQKKTSGLWMWGGFFHVSWHRICFIRLIRMALKYKVGSLDRMKRREMTAWSFSSESKGLKW